MHELNWGLKLPALAFWIWRAGTHLDLGPALGRSWLPMTMMLQGPERSSLLSRLIDRSCSCFKSCHRERMH